MVGLTRRGFLRTCGLAAGAGVLAPRRVRGGPGPSRVVCVSDGRLWSGPGWADADLDPAVARTMLERGLQELTGAADALDALAALIPDLGDPAQRYAIKVNAISALLPSHPTVVNALTALLVEAGARPENIVVFDREDGELAHVGYAVGQGATALVRGTDHEPAGYGEPVALTDAMVRVTRLLDAADHVINLPVLKHHEMTGITVALKNHFGSVDRPALLHGRARDCCPGIADVNALPQVRDKTRLVLVDAAFITYRSGLAGAPDAAPMRLLLSTDPVAADAVGQEEINARRVHDGLDPVVARHLLDAAARGLGTADLGLVDRVDVALAPVVERHPPPESPATACGCAAGGGAGGAAGLGAAGLGAAALGAAALGAAALGAGARGR
jgi:uncharacterized protein (DUF362 family)